MVKLFEFLKANGVDVYFQGQYVGKVKSNIVVLRDAGTIGNKCAGKIIADVILFVPISDFRKIYEYKKEIKEILKGYRCTGNETSIVIDDEKKAYTCSISYELFKRS